jgi:hypothetical protein
MKLRTKIACLLLAGFVVAAGWWTLVPKIHTATPAEVRPHVAPELLEPVLRPAGGGARFAAYLQALQPLLDRRPRERPQALAYRATFQVADPEVRRVLDILREGPLDRSAATSDQQAVTSRLMDGLANAAADAAALRDWPAVRAQLEAAYLLLDCLSAGDVTFENRTWTTQFDATLNRTVLTLAANRELPGALAGQLLALAAVDRYGVAGLRDVLRGEFQQRVLEHAPGFLREDSTPLRSSSLRSWFGAGTYDPVDTALLLSDAFVEAARNAGRPTSQWTNAAAQRIEHESAVLEANSVQFFVRDRRHSAMRLLETVRVPRGSYWPGPVDYVARRVRLNTGRNTLGAWFAWPYNPGRMLVRNLAAQTTQDKIVAALAVSQFRQRNGRDPQGFDELIATGLLRTPPLDHASGQPLPFDLQALFEWPAPARPARN